MGFAGAEGFHKEGAGGGGSIGGGGTLNYVAMFTPDGSNIGNAPIKIGDAVSRALPVNTGTNSIGMGYDILMSGIDNFLIGYGQTDGGGTEIYALGNRGTLTGAGPYFGVVNLGFFNTLDSPGGGTSGIYVLGDSNAFTDFNTFSTIIGESNNLERLDHVSSVGIFHNITDCDFVYNFGENNTLDTVTSSTIIGLNNDISNCSDVLNVGNNNIYTGITGAVVIGLANTSPLSNEILIAIGNLGMRVTQFGDIGIGVPSTDSVLARLHVRGIEATTLANQRLEPTTGVYEDTTGETVTTVDGAVPGTSSLQIIAIPADTVVLIESYVSARKTAGAGAGSVGDGNGYIRTVKAQNIAGVVTIGVVQTSFTSEALAGAVVTYDVSGTDVRLRVTGTANNNIAWNAITKTFPVT